MPIKMTSPEQTNCADVFDPCTSTAVGVTIVVVDCLGLGPAAFP